MNQYLCIFMLILALIAVATSAINKDVQRTIDASSAILKIYIDIKATEVDKEYKLVFPTYQAEKLAFLSISLKGKKLAVSAPVA